MRMEDEGNCSMNMRGTPPSLLRISLRELLAGLAFVAVACAALKYAGERWWTVLSAVALVGFLAAAVVAVIERWPSQARAMGFVLCVAVYALLVWSGPDYAGNQHNSELDPYSGRLPTTKVMRPLFEALVTRQQIMMSGFGGAMMTQESPDRGQFMAIGHLLWAIVLGYFGSRFAGWLYARRVRSEDQSRTE
jgi:hypothetical protein